MTLRGMSLRRPVAGSFSRPGLQRTLNEDCLATPAGVSLELRTEQGYLYVVADGMGGHAAGEQASALAASTVMAEYYSHPSPNPGQALVEAVRKANAVIHRQAQHPETAGMGSTIVAALVRGRDLYVAHVGDSRAYRVSKDSIECLTADHTLVAETVRLGALTPQEAQTHPHRHVLTRALGSEPEVEVDLGHYLLRRGDRIALATDGLTAVISDGEIQEAVSDCSPEAAAQALGELATRRGANDDATVLVIDPFRSRIRDWLYRPSASMMRSTSMQAILAGILLALLVLVGVLWQTGGPGTSGQTLEPLTTPEATEAVLAVPPTATPGLAAAGGPPATPLEQGSKGAEEQGSPFAPLALQTSAPPPSNRADVNGDGVVDIRDVVRISGIFRQPASVDPAADVNGDGQINLFDLVIVASAHEGKP